MITNKSIDWRGDMALSYLAEEGGDVEFVFVDDGFFTLVWGLRLLYLLLNFFVFGGHLDISSSLLVKTGGDDGNFYLVD